MFLMELFLSHLLEHDQHRAGNKNWGVGSDQYTDDQSQDKAGDAGAAKEE